MLELRTEVLGHTVDSDTLFLISLDLESFLTEVVDMMYEVFKGCCCWQVEKVKQDLHGME